MRLLIGRFSTQVIQNSATHTIHSWRESKFPIFTSRMPCLSLGTPLCSFKQACQYDLGGALQSSRWAFRGRENRGSTAKVFLLAEPLTRCREVHQVLHCLRHCQIDHQEARPLYSTSYPQSTLGIHLYGLHVGPSFY
jgi:hypothetical protein